ncbi:hypothetical protein [Oryza sativa Japonica Group]|uniref:Uncharacterized protein n=1 Tax=Oryza sativa subsp. japonica TaxID=39947 RepID=Q5ZC31_ORYSJ|nr:hypothetical protein [Oryza sativa Japonica Group]BAD52920.1 hypothetical protein [Oryza sativa Japonica Group]
MGDGGEASLLEPKRLDEIDSIWSNREVGRGSMKYEAQVAFGLLFFSKQPFMDIWDAQFFQKYTVDFVQPLHENDVGVTSRVVF